MDEILGTAAVPQVGAAVITEESYSTLLGMIKSRDPNDHTMAQLILSKVDVQASIMYIYKLARSGYSSNMVNLRTKAGRKFRDESGLFLLSSYGIYNFACFLNRKDWLTPERFQMLKEDIVNHLSGRDDHTFYQLSFEIRDKYKHLDPDNKLKKLRDDKA